MNPITVNFVHDTIDVYLCSSLATHTEILWTFNAEDTEAHLYAVLQKANRMAVVLLNVINSSSWHLHTDVVFDNV